MRLGILGGSFDPVHRGHRQMARFVLDADRVDQVVVVPAHASPFKDKVQASAQDRLAMARLAFADCAACRVEDIDLRRPRPSFMVDTLELLRQRYPDGDFFLIIGADNLAGFPQWNRVQEILTRARVLVLGRNDLNLEIEDRFADRFHFLEGFDERVSSREIRAMLASGEVPDAMLDPAVMRYIAANALYT